MKSFSNETLKFSFRKYKFLHFGSWQNCMSIANLFAEIHLNFSNESFLSTGEPCTYECITLLQSIHRPLRLPHFMNEDYNGKFAPELYVYVCMFMYLCMYIYMII